MERPDVVIAGAGIIGLSLALDLASHGLRVSVFERGRAMAESSWAAAGMLAASDPENPQPLSELSQYSLTRYPDYLALLEHLSGWKVPLRTAATLQAGHSGRAFSPEQVQSGRRLSPTEMQSIVPQLTPGDREFLLLEEQSLDPRDLCAALPIAARAAGVTLIESSPILSVDSEANAVNIQTPTGTVTAAHFVNCAGAWAESPALGRRTRSQPLVAPRKGQMAAVRLRGGETLNPVLRTPTLYLVPRGDGRIIVGATVEDAGFDKSVEPHAIARLLQAAAELFPPIAHAEVLESWAGLRPGSADGLPLLGRSSQPNCWAATGHFRNGILLAPGTARLLSQAVRGETPDIDLGPFDPLRPVHSTALAHS